MEATVLCLWISCFAELDAGAEFGEDDQVKDDGTGKEGVLTRVVHHEGVVAPEQDLRCVLIHRSLAVACK